MPHDRDLLAMEPRLFHEVAWLAQQRLDARGVGTISFNGDRLTVTGAAFQAWGIGPGWVVLVNDTPLEIINVINDTQLTISRPRLFASDPVIPASAVTNGDVRVHTFAMQLHSALMDVLARFGLTHSALAEGEVLTEAAIGNPEAMDDAIIAAALHTIYTAAAPHLGADGMLPARARHHGRRLRAALGRLRLSVDTDGDGVMDEVRRLDAVRLVRG